jgi:restriction system protein
MEGLIVLLIVGGIVGGIIAFVVVAANRAAKERAAEAERYRQQLTHQYGKPLGLKFRQLVVRDEYGHLNFDRWERELTYFMRNALNMPKPKKNDWSNTATYNSTRAVLDGIAREVSLTLPVMGDISEVRNGIDYEHFTANRFEAAGWDTHVTRATGDQGADVKIWQGDIDGVVQCKWYQNAVGNKAVQEIVAARTHYNVGVAIVVSKSGYTEAAKELASTNGVWLIHHDEINDLYGRLSNV